jgi:hypothetical protein
MGAADLCDLRRQGAERVAIGVGGSMRINTRSTFPEFRTAGSGSYGFAFMLHEDDPEQAVHFASQQTPAEVSVLTFSNTPGDYGPLYPKEKALADLIASPVGMLAIVAAVGAIRGNSASASNSTSSGQTGTCPRCDNKYWYFIQLFDGTPAVKHCDDSFHQR